MFDPPIPSVERAVAMATMGAVVKLSFQFDAPFWLDERFGERVGAPSFDVTSFFQSREPLPFPIWWTSYPVRAPLLVAWVGGPTASALATLPRTNLESDAGTVHGAIASGWRAADEIDNRQPPPRSAKI